MSEQVSRHDRSGRTAIVDRAGASLWFYLSHPNTTSPASDCWLANLGEQTPDDLSQFREAGLPPPAPSAVLQEQAESLPTRPSDYVIGWSEDGEAARVSLGDRPIAFIVAHEKPGFHTYIRTECPWGRPFDSGFYGQLFA